MLYDKIDGIPEPGSLREAVCILVQQKRQDRDYHRVIALAAAAVGESQQNIMMDALEKFRELSFPYIQATKKNVEETMQKLMEMVFAHGPIRVNKQKTD